MALRVAETLNNGGVPDYAEIRRSGDQSGKRKGYQKKTSGKKRKLKASKTTDSKHGGDISGRSRIL
jgi:hypothetical protein